MKVKFLLAIILLALASIGRDVPKLYYFVRAYSPYPLNYVARLQMLDNWDTTKSGFNCSGFISAAHSSRFHHSYDFYENTFGDLKLIREVANRQQIDESVLQPGDIAAFHGPTDKLNHGHEGFHVAVFMGEGVWMAADARVGYVGRLTMSDPSDADIWYQGTVRLYRWKDAPKFSLTQAASNLGKDDSSI